MIVSSERVLRDELEALRKGRGLQEPQIRDRVGIELRRLCSIGAATSHSDARRALTSLLGNACDALPGDLRLAASVMFAIDEGHRHRFLRQRYEALARQWNCDFRTVQRRCDEALDLLADQLQDRAGPSRQACSCTEVFDASAWYLERISVALLLNGERPQAIEERTVVSTTDGLSRLGVAVGLPRHPAEQRRELDVETEVLYGAALESQLHPSENMFVQYLRLPRPLSHGERHTYARSMRIPKGQLMVPRYVHLPVHRCDEFTLRVKFDTAAPPRAVWQIAKIPEMVFTNQRPGPELIELDPVGEVHVRFTDLQLGFGYGVAWQPDASSSAGGHNCGI
jgi:hypothetical protein